MNYVECICGKVATDPMATHDELLKAFMHSGHRGEGHVVGKVIEGKSDPEVIKARKAKVE